MIQNCTIYLFVMENIICARDFMISGVILICSREQLLFEQRLPVAI